MLSVVLCALFAVASYSEEDKAFVVDGALGAAYRQLIDKTTPLGPVSESFSQQFGMLSVPFTLQLSSARLRVEELTRRGPIGYRESESESRFQFQAVLRAKVECDYVLNGGGSAVSSGDAVVDWDIAVNGSLVTESCDLALKYPPTLESELFHVVLYSREIGMNVSYNDHRFNSITSVYQQAVSVLAERALGSIPICEAIPC